MSELSVDSIFEETRAETERPATTASSTVRDSLWYFWAWQPCTLRGLIALVLATAAVRTLAIAEFDLVANVVGWSILFLTAVTFLAVVILRFRLSGRLEATAHFATAAVISRAPVHGGISVRNSSLPPFFTLEIRRIFAHTGVKAPIHIVSGYQAPESPRLLVDEITFPHRGLWELRSLECRISDALGFCALRWRLPLNHRIQVSAADLPIIPLPIVASSHRSGEDLSTATERTGDLFDIKAYDPSDGIRRIMWKTYARSGELVSRRPEPAAIPDGELAIFLIAEREEDWVAGALQNYLEQLAANDIEVLFGTDTFAASNTSRISANGYLTRRHEIQEAIDGDVWRDSAGSGAGFSAFLESLASRGRSLDQVVIFVSAENERWLSEVTKGIQNVPARALIAAVDSDQMLELGWRPASGISSGQRSQGLSAMDSLMKRLSSSRFEVVPVRASMRQF